MQADLRANSSEGGWSIRVDKPQAVSCYNEVLIAGPEQLTEQTDIRRGLCT
jgi:hypothetical protein